MADNNREFFKSTEFVSESKAQDPETVMQARQDPEIAYAHICKIAGTINAGLSVVPEEQRDTAEVYAVVDLFRATMQYIEEFGSYLRYLILDKDSFINEIIRTSSGDIQPLFKAILEDRFEEYLQEYNIDTDPDEKLSTVFGYQAVKEGMISFSEEEAENAPSDFDLTDVVLHGTDGADTPNSDEMEMLVGDSIKNLRTKLKNIAVFYLNFREAYNAVKHGNRFTVGNNSGFKLSNNELIDDRIVLDDAVIEFLCKQSGEKGGDPYLLTIPRSILEEKTLDVVEDVYTLYTQSYDVATLEDGDKINLKFWKATGNSGPNEDDLIQIANPDSRIILPRDVIPEVIDDLKIPDDSKFDWVGNWSLAGSTLVFEVKFSSEPTPEYPIHVEIGWEKTDHDIHEFGEAQFNFSVNTDNLSVKQYFGLLNIQERDDIREIEFDFPGSDETHRQRLEKPFEGINIPQPEDPEFLEYVKRIELATRTRIPLPEYISEKHVEVYEQYVERELDSSTAEEVLSEFQERGKTVRRSFVGVAIWEDDFSNVDIVEEKPTHSEDLGELPGILVLRESPDSNEGERFPGEDHRTDPAPSEYTPEELLDRLKEEYAETVGELQQSEVDSEVAKSEFSHRIRFGHETMWGTLDSHIIDIFPVSEQSDQSF
ncbi:hypothetical protein GJR96_02810 [Haloferax sp. MBLA0076]|uniref:Uncharacterized protein n=1 Tax=Haloferax litoreum TaxID=2666140 RepID=A0A6A8GCU4_9EURY|nr:MULTISPECIES: hypothetical protein [Haloferax]KAB1192428.1 hypothetical protein Hfx1148_02795 [Haloferax sp. CBA1148]MRX20895.1 hypothetical protein [Haloferax litoreum]